MKTILFSLTLLYGTLALSQVSYTPLNWQYDLSSTLPEDSTIFQTADIDGDGINNLQVEAWFGHLAGSTIGILVKDYDINDSEFGHLLVKDCLIAYDCSSSGPSVENLTAYIYTTDCTNNYTSGTIKVPFEFETFDGFHQGLLSVTYEGNFITIDGYFWNVTAQQECSCDTGNLGIEELSLEGQEFYYTNLLGEPVENPEGFVLKVYPTLGITQKVFINQ